MSNVDAVQLLPCVSCADEMAPESVISNQGVNRPKEHGSPLLCECVDRSEDCGMPLWGECVDRQMMCPADLAGEGSYDGITKQVHFQLE